MKHHPKAYFTIPEWDKIPFLIHGFGSKYWKHADFEAHPRMKNLSVLYLQQIHSDIVQIVEDVPEETQSGDALLTDREGLMLVIRTADCLPVLIADPKKEAVAAVHCGWRSIASKLIRNVIRNMHERFRCDPASLLVAFGPCIEKDCYEVGADVKEVFHEKGLADEVFFPHPQWKGKYHLDLRMAARQQLADEGVEVTHISQINLCTYCEETLFSHRRLHRRSGRMLSFIGKRSS